MLIGQLDKGTEITVNVTNGDKSVQIISKIVELSQEDYEYCRKASKQFKYKSFTVVDLMKEGDKVINFLSANIICMLSGLKEGKPYTWNNVKILRVKLPEYGDSHIILSNEDMETFNRRREYRLWLGYDGLCKFGESQVPKNVMVKDISCSGISMIINKDIGVEVELGERVEIQFYDRVYSEGKKDYNNILYTVEAKIVRYIAMNNNRMLIGCRLSQRYQEIDKMIYLKQRLSMNINGKTRLDRARKAVLARELAKLANNEV